MPVGEAPHREVEADPGAEVRLEMCERAVAGDGRFRVSRTEIERPGRSYTVDTLRELAAGVERLVLVLGSDQAATLASWSRPEELLRLAEVAVAEREERRRDDVRAAVAGLPGASEMRFFDMPRIDVSSTLVRERVAVGRPIRYLVPAAVVDLIAARGLYAAPAPVGAG